MSDDVLLHRSLTRILESLHECGLSHVSWPAGLEKPAQVLNAGKKQPSKQAKPVTSSISAPNESHRIEDQAPDAAASDSTGIVAETAIAIDNSSLYPASSLDTQRPVALKIIQAEVEGCTQCGELARCRTQTVFGVGNPSARLCLVGDAPGGDEDRLGEPFVGAAGQLLDRILNACKLSREDVYILNVLKCRPPGNRTPKDNEVANCWGFAHRQLEIIQPEFICCLGAVAARAVLQNRASISRLRGSFHKYRSSQVVVTYHPAYLLRTPSAKQQTWDDMKMLMQKMGVNL